VVLLGYLADKYKLYSNFAVLSPIILILSFLLCLVMHPLIPFIIFGLAGALIQLSLWTCVMLTVEGEKAVR